MGQLEDAKGQPVKVGDIVRQVNEHGTPWYDPCKGALLCNAGQLGVVISLARTRAVVDFKRTRRDVFGTQESTEAVFDKVTTTMFVVQTKG